MSTVQKIHLDINKCIGCPACTHVCPAKLISFTDEKAERVLQFATTCAEDCTRCADACSEAAITLLPADKEIEDTFSVTFPLARCTDCGGPCATEKMMVKLNATISSLLVTEDQDWLGICPACRQICEAKNVAGRGLMIRSS